MTQIEVFSPFSAVAGTVAACHLEVYATETSEMCIPCPDGLECKAGADEKALSPQTLWVKIQVPSGDAMVCNGVLVELARSNLVSLVGRPLPLGWRPSLAGTV